MDSSMIKSNSKNLFFISFKNEFLYKNFSTINVYLYIIYFETKYDIIILYIHCFQNIFS